ncbi:MAG: TIGR03619 family F420-dependent LLM class oxidoreductase [Actinobacteria bacterium]|nr:TIGR03619 family F420-dependent LLM class oxidoreductase [Actinomycetota bacterium]
MRFSYAESMVEPSFYAPLAQAAEEAGYDTFLVPDSICYPAEADSTYPYNADGTREFLEGKPFIEPFSLIPALAAVTSRIRFTTFVLKLPIRYPVLVAKQVTSVGVLTNNRFGLGVGTSPWREDYAVCDVPWERRGRRMDESIDIIRGLGAGGWFEFHGEVYDVPRIKLSPIPTEPVPILIGGHGDAALRRAARLDGWMAAGTTDDELDRNIARLDELRRELGREDAPFEVHAPSIEGFSADGIKRLEDRGVTDVIAGFRDPYVAGPDTQTLQEKLDALRWYADEVIANVPV